MNSAIIGKPSAANLNIITPTIKDVNRQRKNRRLRVLTNGTVLSIILSTTQLVNYKWNYYTKIILMGTLTKGVDFGLFESLIYHEPRRLIVTGSGRCISPAKGSKLNIAQKERR